MALFGTRNTSSTDSTINPTRRASTDTTTIRVRTVCRTPVRPKSFRRSSTGTIRRASLSPRLHQGFRFEGHDIYEHKKISFDSPEELYDMLMSIGSPGKYTIKYVFSRADETIAAASSTERLSLIAGKYVGKDDPVMIVRAHQNFPALGEVLEPFRYAWIIEGWMRGSHYGPLMPVSAKQATPTRVDGPPRVACLGFQLADGRLVGP